MKTVYDDCWHPIPGSWEEAVDPYDEQCVQYQQTADPEQQPELPVIECLPERPIRQPLHPSTI